MRFISILLIGYISLTSPVLAQQLVLRSGDHPTFSRITLQVPIAQPWEARKTIQGVELFLPGHSGGFNTAEVFTRMRRDRIVGFNNQPDKLILQVNCVCIATAFRSGSLLVIDVADSGTELAGQPLSGANLAKLQPKKADLRPAKFTGQTLPWIGGNSPFGATSIHREPALSGVQNEEGLLAPKNSLDEHALLLSQIQETLVEEVANAASIGLLENSYDAPLTTPMLNGENTVPPVPEPIELPKLVESSSQNLRITNSMARPNGSSTIGIDATSSGLTCPKDSFLSVETWGDERAFSAQLGQARKELMDARDRLNKDVVKRLAQTYIYFGFGAEAINALRLDPSIEPEVSALVDVARILEYGHVRRPNALSNFTGCSSSVALWASLSFIDLPAEIVINTDAALLALNRLPKHLRQILAPALSSRFLQYGDVQAATAAMRSVERLPEPLTPDAVMAQADLALHSGKPAEKLLENVIGTNTEQSPSALVKLIEGKLANGEVLSIETATLVEAYAQELRGTDLGNQLRQTQVVALGQSGRFEEAFKTLENILPSLSPTAATDLRRVVLEQLSKKADDLTFLEYAFAQKATSLAALSPQTKLLMANRLMDLGFAAQVQEIISTVPERPRTKERQILAARAALSLRQPFQAQAELIGIDGPDASLILARAKELAGAFREASEIFSNIDASAEATEAAWLSEEWRELIPRSTPSFGAVTTLAQTSVGDQELGPLGQANFVLEESGAARDTLEQLLNDPMIQLTLN